MVRYEYLLNLSFYGAVKLTGDNSLCQVSGDEYRRINSIFDILICVNSFMIKYAIPIGLLILAFCIVFLVLPHQVPPSSVLPYAVVSIFLMIMAGLLMVQLWRKKPPLFVCGECNLTFLSEENLRNHYASEHTKKD